MSDERHSSSVGGRNETLERVSDGVVAFDTQFRYTYLNGRAEELLDRDAQDLLGEVLWEVFPEVTGTVTEDRLRAAMETQEQVSFERYNQRLGRWFEVRAYPDDDGVSVFVQDISERKRQGAKLRERTQQLDALLANIDSAVYVKASDGRYERMNDAAAAVFGLDPETAVGKTDEELFDNESAAEIRDVDKRIGEQGETVTERAVRYVDGERHVFRDQKFPYRHEDGEISGIMGISHNVTERERRDRELERAETLFENAQDALFLIDVENETYRFQRVNPAYEHLTGLSDADLRDKTLGDAFGDVDAAAITERYDRCVEQREPQQYVEELAVPEPGSYWETRIAPVVVDGSVDQIVGATRNVTERKEREQELRETRNTFEAIVRSSPDAIVMLDDERAVTLWNRAAEELFGWSESEVIGESAPFVPEEKREEFKQFIEALDDGEVNRGVQTVRRTKDSERIDVSLSSARVSVDGELVGYMGVFEDISTRRAYERRLERQRDNLELLTEMVSHDIRNDLQMVTAYADLLGEQLDRHQDYVEKIAANAEDAVELTESARDLSEAMRRPEDSHEAVALGPVLRQEIESVDSASEDAEITVDDGIPQVSVVADDMLDSVFRNLLKNAVQHNDKAVAEVTVSVDVDADTVSVRIVDNGPGLPPEKDIFDRGERGLDSGGTGIGLYLVRTLVKRYGGAVRAADNEPTGTVFTVELDHAGTA